MYGRWELSPPEGNVVHSMRLHGDGIAECASCGAVYRLVADRGRREHRDGFDCRMCGVRLDTLIGEARRAYELVLPPRIRDVSTL
jgi:hypothetical protein